MATQSVTDSPEASIFQSNLPIAEKLERARMELLDLSARNRLLNMPRTGKGTRSIEVVDEKASEIFRLLVREGRAFTFLAGMSAGGAGSEADHDEIEELEQPSDDEVDEEGRRSRHIDTRLQTRLTSKGLQKRLLELFYDARTLEEEQGVNILFLTLGALRWIDPLNAANIRHAPLLLIPVALDRGNAAEKFKLRMGPEDYASNLSLEAFLDRVHGIKLPMFEASDDFDLAAYVAGVAEAVSSKPGWGVLPDDITLGFFSFAKFLMYRDLDSEVWPDGARISNRPLIRGLLSEGFDAPDDMLPEEEPIDQHIRPAEMLHIVDSDSSQTLAIYEVRRGRDMVIQGPPGTGKSQTIANIIASAVADGRTVLFVAEKMAALEVVKRRLDATGVGDACLELHSNKANKRALLEELRRTWELGAPRGQEPGTLNQRLTEARDRLNAHVERLHHLHPQAKLTAYQVMGQMARLRLRGEQPNDLHLEGATQWSRDDYTKRHEVISELTERIIAIGKPADHPWRGVRVSHLLPTDVDRLTLRARSMADRLMTLDREQAALAATLQVEPVATVAQVAALHALAHRVAGAPAMDAEALGADVWASRREEISELLSTGETYAAHATRLAPHFAEAAWAEEVGAPLDVLKDLPPQFSRADLEGCAALAELLPILLRHFGQLATLLGRDIPATLSAGRRLIEIAERVSVAPEASPEAFTAGLWDYGLERAADLVGEAARLEEAKAVIGGALLEQAWETDLSGARATLAAHGAGLFRVFTGDWRRANRLVRSILSKPDQPLEDTLAHLDALGRGQAARRALREATDFGQSAFGAHWRGDKSAAEPLAAIVEWMRSLKGLGAEPRLIAAGRPDRTAISEAIDCLNPLVENFEVLSGKLWSALGERRISAFADVASPTAADFQTLSGSVGAIAKADVETARLFQFVPEVAGTRVDLLRHLMAGQAAARYIAAGDTLGVAAFGQAWKGMQSDWGMLRRTATWIAANLDIRLLASTFDDRMAPAATADGLAERVAAVAQELAQFTSVLDLDAQTAVGQPCLEDLSLLALVDRLEQWSRSGEELSRWVAYRDRAAEASALGCRDVVTRLRDGRLGPADAIPAFEMAYFEAVYADLLRLDPELARFDGTLHGRLVKDFADMDLQRIKAASYEVARAHFKRVPPRDGGRVGPLGVLRGEMQKKRAHMPIRKLMERAGPAVQALKPVFMMSPLSVAQFLPPGVFEFDLLVMDEASQIEPVDALGAIARSKQVVVVGDPKQLPPTAFFAKMTGAAGDQDDEESTRVGDIESILGLFSARGLPTRMLRWHYRSRHQSLIAVSNRQFYEGKLFIVPSPYTQEAGMGLRFHLIPNGIFDSGGTRVNVVEAKIVAEGIIRHAQESPDLSLGVVAFSVAQRRAILDQLELIRRTLPPETESYFQAHPTEPFFVKNLENVQGDERDVIFISVGYGPTVPGGKPPMRFGPLGSEGGERRLNVLISRAKQRCEVFSSITDEDIDPDFAATRKGVFAFRLFLHYARTGRLTLAESTGRDHESVFEEQVAVALQNRGYQVHRQVGLAGFFIDLAVADEEFPGRYLLGIECDGASYHSSRSARDRDRLRQSVLESHGWAIHRIWSTDWFRRPEQQLQLIVDRIEAAKAELKKDGARVRRAAPIQIEVVERGDVAEIGLAHPDDEISQTAFYTQAVIQRPSHQNEELHDTPTGLLSELAEKVVAIEGPVHLDEVVSRIRNAWGLKRAGGRIQSAIDKAVAVSVKMGRIARDGDFLSVPGVEIKVRDRSGAESPSLRRAEFLPPPEIRLAVLDVVKGNLGASPDQIVTAVSRVLGIKVTSAPVKEAILSVIERSRSNGDLLDQGGVLVIPG